ncbi:acyl-CoA dehydrogenase [Oceanicola sp. 22II-s10i]|uniref:acyl-CoA dehydrogenase family protein n=1 Tax=Oceanicola sp. 22II-s10i TaxID=1317116 RepID=UPI000B51EE79|nr:acyl-CoA dehydrogenase family protein [Oceanicola sp. 22II-s10i]OWU86261.1 acyl-CoA dehydrogenase [Oceanicola sp. 22II-s10i]
MDFSLTEEQQMLRDLVARFVRDHLIPLEPKVLAREAEGGPMSVVPEEREALDAKAEEFGLTRLESPEEFGGMNLDATSMVGVFEELGKSCIDYNFPPDSPNLHMLMKTCSEEQRKKYLEPYARGEAISAIAISEPNGGGDPASMITRAVQDGNGWKINGRKIWISKADKADFTILMAVTDPGKGARGGISAFVVDKDTPGFNIARRIRMLGGRSTYEIAIEDLKLPGSALLGELGNGYGPMQLRLSMRRVEMGAKCAGMTRRALDLMKEWVKQRKTFGDLLSNRQSIQWWIADAEMQLHALRLMVYNTATKIDRGEQARTECSMVKLMGTELAWDTVDKAMQAFGAMGMTKELPLQMMANLVRGMRIYEGPSEVHRMLIARHSLQDRIPGL